MSSSGAAVLLLKYSSTQVPQLAAVEVHPSPLDHSEADTGPRHSRELPEATTELMDQIVFGRPLEDHEDADDGVGGRLYIKGSLLGVLWLVKEVNEAEGIGLRGSIPERTRKTLNSGSFRMELQPQLPPRRL